jgi:hypothetical protein
MFSGPVPGAGDLRVRRGREGGGGEIAREEVRHTRERRTGNQRGEIRETNR